MVKPISKADSEEEKQKIKLQRQKYYYSEKGQKKRLEYQKKAQDRYHNDPKYREKILKKQRERLKNPEYKRKIYEADSSAKREKYTKSREFRDKTKDRVNKYRSEPEKKRNLDEKSKLWKEKNKEKMAKWRAENYKINKEKINKDNAERYQKNREKYDAKNDEWKLKNKERYNATSRAAAKRPENRVKINARYNNRRKNSPQFRARLNLKQRLYEVVKSQGGKKLDSTKNLIGCDWQTFVKHIEKSFYNRTKNNEPMTWDNYGEWHMDHIKPISSFDLRTLTGQKESMYYKNIQALWAEDNHDKNDRLDWEKVSNNSQV